VVEKRALGAGGAFVAAGLITGVLSYLFQVVATRSLEANQFATLAAWIAYLSFGFVIASMVQYASGFHPLSKSKLRVVAPALAMVSLFSSGILVGVGVRDPVTIALIGVANSSLMAFLYGQAQYRTMFLTLAIGTLVTSSIKLIYVLPGPPEIERYYWALAYAPVAGAMVFAYGLFRYGNDERQPLVSSAWRAAIVMAIASILFPQFELALMRHTQPPAEFVNFAKASLFYKGAFFLFLIGAQWILPYQLKSGKELPVFRKRLFAMCLVTTICAVATTPFVGRYLLNWTEIPALEWIALSSGNMCLLTWIFLIVQEYCTKGRDRTAAYILAAVAIPALLQFAISLSVAAYYSFAIPWNAAIIAWTIWRRPTSPA
jgi:hypothetical protein